MTRLYDQMFNWPNVLTIVRISVIPLLVVFYYSPVPWGHLAAAILFTIASFTDWLDGYLARYLKQSTKLGAFLDPVADKLMVSIAVSSLGKIKTAMQMLTLIVLLYCNNTTPAALLLTSYVLLYISAILTLWSMMIYLKAAFIQLEAHE